MPLRSTEEVNHTFKNVIHYLSQPISQYHLINFYATVKYDFFSNILAD